MKTINSLTLLVGITVVIVVLGVAGIVTTQAVYAQAEVTTAAQDLTTLLTTITGIITTIAALAGGIIASFAKMSQKLGTSSDLEIKKMLIIAEELQHSDAWSKQLDERLVAVGQVIEALPGGKDLLEQKRVDIKRWNEEASNLDGEISSIYKKLIPLLVEKKYIHTETASST